MLIILSVKGGRLKSRGGGGDHVNFHAVSRDGIAFNFDFPVGGGGHVKIVDYSHNGTASICFFQNSGMSV